MKPAYILILLTLGIQNIQSQDTDDLIQQMAPRDLLAFGVFMGNLQYIKSAISKGADINPGEGNPLCMAISSASRQVFEENGAGLSTDGGELPSRSAYISVVKWLLQNGADPNLLPENNLEEPPLLLAAYNRDLEIVKLLLDFKANPNLQNHFGNTALHVLAGIPVALPLPYESAPEIAGVLLSAGAKNMNNYDGESPLTVAKNNISLVENDPVWESMPFYNSIINGYKGLIDFYNKL